MSRSSVEFRLGGRKVSSRQFFDGIQKEMLSQAEAEIERRLRGVRDPETGQPVKVTRRRVAGKTSWDVEGSPKAVAAARKILGGQS